MLRKDRILVGTEEEILEHFRVKGKEDVSSTLTIKGQIEQIASSGFPNQGIVFFFDKVPVHAVDGAMSVEMLLTSIYVHIYSNEEGARRDKLREELNAQNHMG